MEQVNLSIDPSKIAYGFLSSKREINENIEVEKAITQNFYCQKCNKEILGVKFKQINNDKWKTLRNDHTVLIVVMKLSLVILEHKSIISIKLI